jgi:hypothetical protein
MNRVNVHLAEISELYYPCFLEELWGAIDDAICLKECEVYSYVPDMDGDPFSECLWSFNYFFCNKQAHKVLYFVCMAKTKFSAMDSSSQDDDESSEFEGSDEDPSMAVVDEEPISVDGQAP